MLNPRRQSAISPAPGSPSAIPRPHSVAGSHRPRLSSDAASQRASPEPDVRNVRVVLRVRPSNPDDAAIPPRYRNTLVHPTSATEVRVDVDPATLIGAGAGPSANAASGSKRHPTFNFDSVLGESSSQEDLYDATSKDVVDEFLKGHNVTFLAYGQTSSGKSYSMGTTGEDADYSGTDFTPRTGLIPRTVSTIFERAEALRQSSGPGASWECRLSFLELYNEEIIDLLSGTGVSISIREERDGRIIWSGVREVKVRSLAEVMQYLYEGSARRKTGETGMNATSSRSHAIFSLTLVQKRKNLLVASASQPLGEVSTPTRQLKRPTSMIGIAAARSPTPSGTRSVVPPSAFSKGGSAMSRPNSFVGPSPSDAEYVVVTSKFNMVDLAGSERLKRTAAQGDRMKEGISINSGLLALGNVISTLADPIKARGHIPYRDSKLTRMLQDSIGGNALTTMIACVSPVEYNINETINTIKYASRARNIKNTAKINAVEAGWDDVEHLQALVIKLRKQLANLDANLDAEGGSRATASTHRPDDGGSEKLLQRLAELQREHTELYDRYLGKCSENMRLTSELRNANPGDGDALDKFNETVEPVILEYEKVVGALNQQLDELRAELTNISDLHEEQATQLLEAQARQAQNDSYVSELRSRVAKLTERNTSGEAYIQDLETKLKAHADKADSHGDAVTELRKEIARLKEANDRLSQHSSEIETRLTKSEGHAAVLIAQIEKHEKEVMERVQAYRDLEAHVALLDTSKDNKLLLESLAEKEQRISQLEQQIIDQTAGLTEREQLRQSVQVEKAAQAELRAKLAHLEVSSASSTRDASIASFDDAKEQLPNRSPVPTVKELTPPESPSSVRPTSNDDHVAQLEAALRDLEARCADAEARYSEAEHQIAELSTQLSEAKLVHAELDDVMPVSPGAPSPGITDDTSESGSTTTLQTPRGSSRSSSPVRFASQRGSTSSTLAPVNGAVALKHRDFRHGRGSFGDLKRARPQSLSQELSSAQSLESSPRASWTGPPSALRLATSPSKHRQSLPAASTLKPLRSPSSLEAELRFVHEVVEKRDGELKDREAYIRQLEETLRLQHLIPSRKNSANSLKLATKPASAQLANGRMPSALAKNIPLPDSPVVLRVEIRDEDQDGGDVLPAEHTKERKLDERHNDQKGDEAVEAVEAERVSEMSPSSSQRFNDLKNTLSALASLDQNHAPDQEVQERIDTLLREMAVKESSQRAIIEQQFVQIADLQKANNKLKDEFVERESTLSSSVTNFGTVSPITSAKRPSLMIKSSSLSSVHSALSHSSPTDALNRLREEHADELQALLKGHAHSMEEVRREHAEAVEKHLAALADAQTVHTSQLEAQRESHEQAMANLRASHDTALLDLQTGHEAALRELTASHDSAFADLKREHDVAIHALSREQQALMEEMERSLASGEEQRRQLKMKADQAAFEVSRIRDETAIQRNTTMKQLAELQKVNVHLEKSKADLQAENEDLSRRIIDMEQRSPRKSSSMPPQGPPPKTPLPPLPSQFATPIALTKELSSDGTVSSSTHRSTESQGSTATAPTSVENVGAAVAQLPEPVGQMVQKVLAERDAALASKKEMMAEAARAKDLEAELLEERVKADNLSRDLHDARKMNSKMRAHLEDARNESKRLSETCKEHLSELSDRRNTMSMMSRETGQQRDSLLAANAQVAALKAQLDRAVEQKVNKKLNQRLKCF